jgi:hypothetical protein
MLRINHMMFPLLLASLLVTLIVQPQVSAWPGGAIVWSMLGSLVQIAAIVVLAENRKLRRWAWIVGLPVLISLWGRHGVSASSQETAMVTSHVLQAIFLAMTAALILRYAMSHDITAHSIVAAICAYLLIGVVFGHACFVVATLEPEAYRTSDQLTTEMPTPDSRAAILMYYSFTTLTTTGYGDVVPNLPFTRTLAWLEAATGQLYLAVLIAGVVSMHVNQRMTRLPAARGHGPGGREI